MSNGNFIGFKKTPTAEEAQGTWGLRDVFVARKQGIWPDFVSSLVSYTSLQGDNGDWLGTESLVFGTHDQYTVTPISDITVDVKMWGAGGACGFIYTESVNSTTRQGPGGGGGYTSGRIVLKAGTTYYFRIGEGGIRSTTLSSGATYIAGGMRNSTNGGTEGGGYSGIFRSSVSQANALLIAGGGGGGSDSAYGAYGGAGGGSSGQDAPGGAQSGSGGTQSAGGAPSAYNGATAGSALTGGLSQSVQSHSSQGGGGGGYFGGGGGNAGGGGGGSGHVKTTDADVISGSTSTGSSSTPANSSDTDRGTAGQGGVAGSTSGNDGKIIITLVQ